LRLSHISFLKLAETTLSSEEMVRLTASWGNKCGPVGN
jgi:hypothetical protein